MPSSAMGSVARWENGSVRQNSDSESSHANAALKPISPLRNATSRGPRIDLLDTHRLQLLRSRLSARARS